MVEQAQQLLMTCLFWLLRVSQPWSTMVAGENASLTSKRRSRQRQEANEPADPPLSSTIPRPNWGH
jgi:hypothetical protein